MKFKKDKVKVQGTGTTSMMKPNEKRLDRHDTKDQHMDTQPLHNPHTHTAGVIEHIMSRDEPMMC